MSNPEANEFTPLLPAEEHGPQENQTQNQNASSNKTGLLRPDEAEQPRHRQSNGRGSRQLAAAAIFNRGNRGSTDEAISSAIDDDYDGGELVRSRSRLNSYPVLPTPESIKKRDEQTVSTIGQVGSQEQGEVQGKGPEDDPNSKYMRVGALRFWLVFATVLLGMATTQNMQRYRRCTLTR